MTEFRLLKNTDTEVVLDYINKNAIETAFLYANVIQFGIENDGSKRRCADYYGFFEDDKILGILPFYNLGSCIPHYIDDRAIEVFAEKMISREFEVLLGMAGIVNPLANIVNVHKTIKDDSDDSYYVNDNFKPFKLGDVRIEDVKSLPKDKVIKFSKEMHETGFGRHISDEEIEKSLQEKGDEETFLILSKDGEYVADANIQTYTDQICQVGGVYTSPDHRGNGYAKAVVSAICEIIVGRGKMPTLMVTKENTPAVKAYQALGFRHYDDYKIISYKI